MAKTVGHLFVVTAPSGTGKTTITRQLQQYTDIYLSVSYTTRPPRAGEVDGKSYFFTDETEFMKMRENGEFLEHATVYDHHYATPKQWVLDQIAQGRDVVLEIDVAGAKQIRRYYADAVLIFIMPPDMEVLHQRLTNRGTDSETVIKRRWQAAQDEVAQKDFFDYVIINDRLETAIAEVRDIITNHYNHKEKH